MATLNSDIQRHIEELIQKCGIEYQKENYNDAIALLEKSWDILPCPKVIYDESYRIAKYIIQFCLLAKDVDKAKRWAGIISICDLERADSGEREFLAGKVAYESNDLQMAKEYFYVANWKSEGRCFIDEDSKYLNLLEN